MKQLNFTISDESMAWYELNKKLTVARQRSFIFIHINNFKIKVYSNLSHINKHTLLSKTTNTNNASSHFIKIAQNRDYIQTFCKDRRILFQLHVAKGIYMIIHNDFVLYIHVFKYKYLYKYLYICTNSVLLISRKP